MRKHDLRIHVVPITGTIGIRARTTGEVAVIGEVAAIGEAGVIGEVGVTTSILALATPITQGTLISTTIRDTRTTTRVSESTTIAQGTGRDR